MLDNLFRYRKDYGFYLLILTAFLLPWDKIYGSIAIGLTFTYALFYLFQEKKSGQLFSIAFLSCIILYLAYVLGLLNSENSEYAISFLGKKISLFLFPIIFAIIKISEIQKRNLIFVFIISYSLRGLYFLGHFIFKILNSGFQKKWSFQEIESSGGFHPTYMGLYSLVSIVFLMYFLNKKYYSKKLNYLLLALQVVLIYVLAARIVFITLLLLILIYGIFQIVKYKKLRKKIIIIGIILVPLFISGVFLNQDFRYKFLQLKTLDGFKYNKYDAGSISSRIAKWTSAFEISKRHPFLGCGTGDLPEALMHEFKKIECLQCVVAKYNNPHNQYLDALARNGILGLLALLFMLGFPIYISIKFKNIYVLLLNITFCFIMMSECILNKEKGIELFCFINSYNLFYFVKHEQNKYFKYIYS